MIHLQIGKSSFTLCGVKIKGGTLLTRGIPVVTCNDCIRHPLFGPIKSNPKSCKSCNACDDKGYVIESGTLMRCDICKQFTGDLDAAQAFFKLKSSKDWALSRIIIRYTKGRPV